MQKGIIRKEGQHEQKEKMTQTWLTDGKRGSNENQTWMVTLIDKGVWNVVKFILKGFVLIKAYLTFCSNKLVLKTSYQHFNTFCT